MSPRPLVPILAAWVLLAACGGGGGSGGADGETAERGPNARPPADLAAPAASVYGTAYNICLKRSEDDIDDDPRKTAEAISSQYPAPYRDAGVAGCLGAFEDRGLLSDTS
jgi:hypothetical protein